MTTTEVGADVPQLRLTGQWTTPRQLITALFQARQLCETLARKNFFVQYRRATFGMLWAIVLPAVQAVVLAVVLSRVARFSIPHYPVYIFAGMVGWTYFSSSLGAGATAIVDNASLSSKIYFPRAVLPISVCLSNLFALAMSTIVLLVVAIATGATPGWHTLYLLPGTVIVTLLATSLTLVFSAIHVYLRDVKYVVQAALLAWFYVTPNFYPLTVLHGGIRTFVEVNPLTGVVELFHAGAVNGALIVRTVFISIGWTCALLALALVLHCRNDRSFADLL